MMLCWEDFVVGDVSEFGPRTLTRDEIKIFAAAFDPQSMHLDEAAARDSMLGGLAASGWQSCCLVMRMANEGFLGQSSLLGTRDVEEVRWRAPVRPDEPLRVRATVLAAHSSESRRGIGFIDFLFELVDSVDTRLMTLQATLAFARRSATVRLLQPRSGSQR